MGITEFHNFINGEIAKCDTTWFDEIIDPSTGEIYAHAPISTKECVNQAYLAAKSAFISWRKTTPEQRQMALLDIADSFEKNTDILGLIESKDTGKPLEFARGEVKNAISQIRFFAGQARNLNGQATAEYKSNHTSSIRREPIGVIGQITPWNYPLLMAVWKFIPAIAAGNTVVLKPSDTTPASALMMAQLAAEHLPAGVFNVVLGNRDTGRLLVENEIPQMVAITGSVRAGIEVAKSAAADVKRVHLELGGNAPVIIFPNADLNMAAKLLVEASFYNAGQDCTAASRYLVHEKIRDQFLDLYMKEIKENGQIGLPQDEGILFSSLNNINQKSRMDGFLNSLPTHASIVLGGSDPIKNGGYFQEATVITDLKQDDYIVQEEIFGPIITIQTFSDETQALTNANDVKYGLAASVFTSDHSQAMRLSRNLNYGCVWINTHSPLVAEMPHGGFGHSGYGKDLSVYGFEDYTRIKHVMSRFEE